jgi:hypothetical protein
MNDQSVTERDQVWKLHFDVVLPFLMPAVQKTSTRTSDSSASSFGRNRISAEHARVLRKPIPNALMATPDSRNWRVLRIAPLDLLIEQPKDPLDAVAGERLVGAARDLDVGSIAAISRCRVSQLITERAARGDAVRDAKFGSSRAASSIRAATIEMLRGFDSHRLHSLMCRDIGDRCRDTS